MQHKIEELKLKNGARLINVVVDGLPVSIVSVWFRAGSRFDPVGKEGLAHFLEHVLMKRTQKYPNEIERLREIESNGIKYNAYTSYETVHYHSIQPKSETYKALDFLIDGLQGSILKEEDIEKEKAVVASEMAEHESNPREQSWNLSYQALWKDSKLGRNFFGTKEGIEAFCVGDLSEFIERHYTPENCLFLVVGNEKTSELGAFLDQELLLTGEKPELLAEKFESPEKIVVFKKDDDQVTISVSHRTFALGEQPDKLVAANFICDYLGNNWTSKLVEELRIRRNLVYWVDAETMNFSDTGILRLIFSCESKRVKEALEVIFGEIEKIKKTAFLDEDLNAHKKSILASMAVKFTDPYEYLWWYGWQAVVGGNQQLLKIEDYMKLMEKIDNRKIQEVAREIFKQDNFSVVAIGDIKAEEIVF